MKFTLLIYILSILLINCESSKDVQSFMDPKTLAKITIEITLAGEDDEKQKRVYERYNYDLNNGPKMYRDSIRELYENPQKRVTFNNALNRWLEKKALNQDISQGDSP
ncbi:MAG TPA: hypothetical protein ENI73_03550 [Spirochaetes bacterium]|nr:hypothetical protein [Spirochaetota bacterium]